MAKTQAERARKYRDRKRDAVKGDSVTVHHENVTVNPDSVTDLYESSPDMISMSALMGSPTPEQLTAARARRTDPELINWGPWMNSDELQAHKQQHKLAKYHNRSPIPGDWDYVGVAV